MSKKKNGDIIISVKELRDELVDNIYSYQTGKFPVGLSKFNQYKMAIC